MQFQTDRRSRGFSLVEMMIAIALLGMLSAGTMTAIPLIQYRQIATSMRSRAMMSMAGSLETLRSMGYESLAAKLTWNGDETNDLKDAWEYDPVAGGEVAASSVIRQRFVGGDGAETWTAVPEDTITATQSCTIAAAGTLESRQENILRVTVSTQWEFRGRTYEESLYTIIQH